MAKIQKNFVAGRMNKSIDERLVPQGEYIDALNVRLGSTEGTEIGAVENSKGNELLVELKFLNQKFFLTIGDILRKRIKKNYYLIKNLYLTALQALKKMS